MEKRRLGKSDLEITPILMGTWQAGKRGWVGVEDDDSIQAIRSAVDSGITTIDTAEVYGDGHSEKIVAASVSDIRDKVEYATKVFASHLKREQVIEACDRSLKNLQTDYIDLYQIHWPSGSFNTEIVPIEETMSALNHLQEAGKIRAIGVSNFSHAQLKEASKYGRIDSLQPPYSLFWRHVESDAMPYCIENDISIIAYSPLAQGLLTGKFTKEDKLHSDDVRSKNKLFQPENMERVEQALTKLRPIAQNHNCSLAQLAIAWLIAQPQSNAIVGAKKAEQVKENAQAAGVKLTPEEIQTISDIGLSVTQFLDNNPVMWNFN